MPYRLHVKVASSPRYFSDWMSYSDFTKSINGNESTESRSGPLKNLCSDSDSSLCRVVMRAGAAILGSHVRTIPVSA